MAIGRSADTYPAVPRLADVLRVRVVGILLVGETLSILGDQLARVALSVLVFDRTGSASATALTYASTYLPAVAGGVFLAGIGDRYSRRTVMIVVDVARAAIFTGMAVSGLPLAGLVVLLAVAVFLGPAFSSAEVSYLAAVLDRASFRSVTGLRMVAGQLAQVAGFALGGVIVSVVHPNGALLVDAATFLASATLVSIGVRPDAARAGSSTRVPDAAVRVGVTTRLVGDPYLWGLLALSALAGLFVVPEALAVPFSAQIGVGTTQAGLLLAVIPLGGAVGALAIVRLVPLAARAAVARAMAAGCGLPLVLTAVVPHRTVALIAWGVSGLLGAYQVEVFAALVHAFPVAARARLVGIGSAVLLGAQGVGPAVFGAVAQVSSPARAVGVAGGCGTVLAAALIVGPLRRRRPRRPMPGRYL